MIPAKKNERKVAKKCLAFFGQIFDELGVGRGICGIIKKILSVLIVGRIMLAQEG